MPRLLKKRRSPGRRSTLMAQSIAAACKASSASICAASNGGRLAERGRDWVPVMRARGQFTTTPSFPAKRMGLLTNGTASDPLESVSLVNYTTSTIQGLSTCTYLIMTQGSVTIFASAGWCCCIRAKVYWTFARYVLPPDAPHWSVYSETISPLSVCIGYDYSASIVRCDQWMHGPLIWFGWEVHSTLQPWESAGLWYDLKDLP